MTALTFFTVRTPATGPALTRLVARLARGGGPAVLLNADLVVVRPLTPLLEHVEEGQVVAFVDRLATRSFTAWEEFVGAPEAARAPAPVRQRGFLALPEH